MSEYAVRDSIYTALVNRFSQSSPLPIIFCAGMARGPNQQGYIEDEAWLYVNTPRISQGYSEHFHAKRCGAKLFDAYELIPTASEVRVFVSQRWTLCVLICVEVLALEIVDQLAKLGTNLLLVPAMSEKTTSMATAVSALRLESQAFVVMANGPAEWSAKSAASRCEAFFAGPYGSFPSSWCATLAEQNRQSNEITARVFHCLAKRAHVRDRRNFSQAVGLVIDLGRLVVHGSESDIRQAQSAVSAVREQLRDEPTISSPAGLIRTNRRA